VIAMRLAAICLLLGIANRAYAADPHPPQLDVSVLAQPAPIVQDGSRRLVYEMLITNFAKTSYVIDSIDAAAGSATFSYKDVALAAMMYHLGIDAPKDSPANRTIDGGGSVLVYLLLEVGKSTPRAIEHVLHVLDDKGGAHDIAIAPLPVSAESAIVVAPPLRGEWIAGDSVSNAPDAAHRRTVLIENGHPWLAQRFAIDWVQYQTVDGVRTTWKGPEDKNESYFCYDQPIYSVAAGTVVEAVDGLPENVPHSGKYAIDIDFNNAAGNHAVIEIAPHRYVLYAHMRPGTVKVKAGDRVRAAEIIGHVGNTGSSTEPHLHMHIDDHPSFLAGNGVPYEFTQGLASGPIDANVSSPGVIHFGEIGPQRPFTNDYPAANALVTFR
jgi:hypothetical protein